jgi:predicted GNAT superfamily acetyltransferase
VTASTVPGLGYELKMHQRQWALANGLAAITWTFDPLIRRNCVFNFEKLGAKAVEYLPNFYGNMADSINLGDDSDRLFVVWPLEAETVIVTEEKMWVTIPEDIESLRQTDLEAALVWRTNVRQIMAPWFADGAVIRSINPERSAVLIERIAR